MTRPPGESGDGVRSVARALELLGLFDETHRSRSVRELIDATGLPKSTVVRLVATLEQSALLWTGTDGRLAPGAGLLRWARLAQDAWQLPPEAVECLRTLSIEAGGESTRIYVRQGVTRVCVAQHEGTQQLRHVVRIGAAMPLWAGASGHVLLAGCSDQELRRAAIAAARGAGFEDVLADRVRRAGEQNWSVSHGEREDGVSAAAAPITAGDEIVAAVALGGPTTRFTGERVAAFLPALSRAAEQLSALRFLGGSS
ncbi:IclR family transcriptional regulator [Saccharopolyspora sp. 6T]|uniref:IclR family transcriptional regulator n=1 Tax=Saccharopolyspora sp. 6T TaxID=2877238 RepID=UPI001CD6947B|nr:IclR family transcriptional regulator [Saccharopolyspora sp. 6T]MCA1187073.1 IclR family transcriptional regulator [Saccharopolyspora sp. 6T]